MRSVNIVVFILAAGTLVAVVALFLWRRRAPAPVRERARPRPNERTLFETTYEQIGVARPEPPPEADDATACVAFDQLGLQPTPTAEATALVPRPSKTSWPS